ncbi:MAG: PTS lactose/cellobiose transporter subunit IIA [Clostridia bacterium]|nr:PTS lactose/cellobiose transporter subunit IIA [Clostridia bacterium]
MENIELICLQIISNAGEARSESMAALTVARNGRFDEAEEHLAAAGEKMKEAHHVHTELITMDANGELDKIGLIMIHSEDIVMGAEITWALAKEMVEMYKSKA